MSAEKRDDKSRWSLNENQNINKMIIVLHFLINGIAVVLNMVIWYIWLVMDYFRLVFKIVMERREPNFSSSYEIWSSYKRTLLAL